MDPSEPLYRLRTDLVLSLQGAVTIVKDPIGDTFVRLATTELVIAKQFDGSSTIEQIRARLLAKHMRVSTEKLITFRDKLQKLQLIMTGDEKVTAKERSLEGLSSGGLARLVVIPLPFNIDPDRFLERLAEKLRFIFTRPFAVASVVILLLACQVWLDRWDDILITFKSYRATGRTLFSVWLVTSTSVALHELAHGLCTKVYGGRVRRMGVFLYYFLLIFYTDVSDAWLFRDRYKQFMVMAVGAWSSALLWAIATLSWRITIPGSEINHVASLFMNVNVAISTLTLIPLVQSDGYHMLSGLLDIPNLRPKALGYTRTFLKRTLFLSKEPLPPVTPREARIYLGYGLVALPFMTLLFAWAGTGFLGWFLGGAKAWGLLLIALFFAVRFRVWARVSQAMSNLAERTEPSEGRSRVIGRFVERLRGLFSKKRLIVLAVLIAIGLIPAPLHVSGRFEIINPEPTEVRTLADGVVVEILVKAGDEVKTGQVVAKLLDEGLLNEKAEREAELEQVRAQLELVENGFAKEEIESARIAVEEQKEALSLGKTALARDEKLHAQGFVTEKELEASHREVVRRKGLLGRAQQEYLLKFNGRRKEEIREARAKVEMLVARIKTLEQHVAWTNVVAIATGRVITSNDLLQEQIGRSLLRGAGILKIVDSTKLAARVLVPEHEFGDVAIGQHVTLRAYQSPGDELSGDIEWIQPEVQRPPNGTATLAVLTRIEASPPLPLGTSGMAKIDCGWRAFGYLVYRRLLRSVFVELWSWW